MRLTWIHFLYWIWAAPCPCNTIVQPPMVLQRNHMEVIERSERVNELEPMISCVETIAREWFMNKERVPLLIPNFIGDSGLSKAFVTGLQNEVVTFSVTEDFSNSPEYRGSTSAVILIRDSKDIYLLSNLTDLCVPRCRYVVCLLTFFNDKETLIIEANAVVEAMWKNWIANFVIIASYAGKFVVAGSYSFESNLYRTPKKPEILGECRTLGTIPNEYIFHKLLMNNCTINITVSDCPPYMITPVEEDGTNFLTGIEGNLLETVTKKLNISLNRLYVNVSMNSSDDIYTTLLDILHNRDESDVVACGLYWNKKFGLEYSATFDRQEIIWLVPSISTLSLLGLVTPLDNSVWFAVIGLLLLTGIIKVFAFRKLSFLSVLGLILGIALPQQPTSLSKRIHFASWVFFGYVITQSYLASLAGQLMNTNYDMITSMAELWKSGISFGGTDRHRALFQDNPDCSSEIYEAYKVLSEDEHKELMKAMSDGKNNTMALIAEIEVSAIKFQSKSDYFHKLAEILASHPIAFAVWEGLPYLDQINDKVIRLRETGIINYWSEKFANHKSSTVEMTPTTELDMLHLSPSFLLLLLGHALSIIVFCIEIGVYTRKNKVRLQRRNKVGNK